MFSLVALLHHKFGCKGGTFKNSPSLSDEEEIGLTKDAPNQTLKDAFQRGLKQHQEGELSEALAT